MTVNRAWAIYADTEGLESPGYPTGGLFIERNGAAITRPDLSLESNGVRDRDTLVTVPPSLNAASGETRPLLSP